MAAEFAYAQWPWGSENREQYIQSCKDLSEVGFRYFESVKSFIDVFNDDIPGFKAISEEYDLKPISFYFHLSGDIEADVADLKKKIGFVAANDIRTITLQAQWKVEPATQEDLNVMLETINRYGEICKEYGVIPCVHPHYNTTIMRGPEIDFIMQNTDPDVIGFGPDTAHLAAGGCNVADVLERYKDRIRFVHLKDLKGAMESGGMQAGVEVYSSFRELGNGDIDFDSVFRILKSVDYSGYLCCELDQSRYGHKLSALLNRIYLEKNWNK